MLQNFITPDEFKSFYDVSRFVKLDSAIEQALRASTYELEETLMARGFPVSRLQPPSMFDGVGAYKAVTKASDYTSAVLEGGDQSRFVVEALNDASCFFSLEGSQDGSEWMPVKDITGSDCRLQVTTAGTYSRLFLGRFPYYRMVLTTSDSIQYRAYLTDSGPDKAIRSRAMYLLFVPFADKDSNLAKLSDVAMDEYRSAMDSQLFSITSDVTDDESTGYVRHYVRATR